jgi:hypothetical protein
MAPQQMWEPLEQVSGWVHQLAHVRDDAEVVLVEERHLHVAVLLLWLQEQAVHAEPLWQHAILHLLTVTASDGSLLLFCSQVPDVPRTTHALEQACGQVRSPERRATASRDSSCMGRCDGKRHEPPVCTSSPSTSWPLMICRDGGCAGSDLLSAGRSSQAMALSQVSACFRDCS